MRADIYPGSQGNGVGRRVDRLPVVVLQCRLPGEQNGVCKNTVKLCQKV